MRGRHLVVGQHLVWVAVFGARAVRKTVGVVPRGRASQFAAGVLIERDELVGSRGGGEDAMLRRYDDHPVHILEPVDGAQDLPGADVDLDDLACAPCAR